MTVAKPGKAIVLSKDNKLLVESYEEAVKAISSYKLVLVPYYTGWVDLISFTLLNTSLTKIYIPLAFRANAAPQELTLKAVDRDTKVIAYLYAGRSSLLSKGEVLKRVELKSVSLVLNNEKKVPWASEGLSIVVGRALGNLLAEVPSDAFSSKRTVCSCGEDLEREKQIEKGLFPVLNNPKIGFCSRCSLLWYREDGEELEKLHKKEQAQTLEQLRTLIKEGLYEVSN